MVTQGRRGDREECTCVCVGERGIRAVIFQHGKSIETSELENQGIVAYILFMVETCH